MKPSTKMVRRPLLPLTDVDPLTTPIFETTSYVFDSAAQVREYNEGRSAKYLYTRYGNPTITAVEGKLAAAEGAESALLLSSGQAATSTALLALLQSGVLHCGRLLLGHAGDLLALLDCGVFHLGGLVLCHVLGGLSLSGGEVATRRDTAHRL